MGCSGRDWDPQKRVVAWHRRHILFEDACCVFEDQHRIEVLEDRAPGPWIISARKADLRLEDAD